VTGPYAGWPKTAAGKRLRDQYGHVPWLLPHIDGQVAAIEAEAAHNVLTALRAEVEGLPQWHCGLRKPNDSTVGRAAVLDLIDKAMEATA